MNGDQGLFTFSSLGGLSTCLGVLATNQAGLPGNGSTLHIQALKRVRG